MNRIKKRNRNLKWSIGLGTVSIVILGLTFLQLNESSVYFFTPKEAVERAPTVGSQTIRVGGMVKPGSMQWEPMALSLNFVISNLKGIEIAIAHTGTPPDMFKEGQGVIVEGQITPDGSSMKSRNLMVKHSEEYQKPDAHHSNEPELLKKELFKNEEKY